MKENYEKTIKACFIGYIVQAIINNFLPLLFVRIQSSYSIPLSQITVLVTFNFGIQLCVDLLSVKVIDKIGYRISMIVAHVFSALGLVLLTILPELLTNAFYGFLIAVTVYAIGGGILEVLLSPVVEACPSENKEKSMSMLHSFYCWGHVSVVLISTLFFRFIGTNHWKFMTFLWAIVPLINIFSFFKVPMISLAEEEKSLKVKDLLQNKLFWLFFIMMVCSGASEQAVSQWASTFAERGLGVTKVIGDLAGPMMFAALMGIARTFYGKYGEKISLDHFMIGSSVLCIISYMGISLLEYPVFNLMACGLCGLSVGIMWPGTFSKSASVLIRGGTPMFSLLALGGDLGCSLGPTLVGFVSGIQGENLKVGILVSVIFPLLLLIGTITSKGRRIRPVDK